MEQNKIQQKLLSFDISSLSSNDDFSKVFELLSQIEDKDFIQYIQQKLENNLAFKDFAKNQPDLVSSLNRENNLSFRLAGLVSERQKESNLKATSSIGSRTVLQQQIQNIIFGGAYIEGIKQAFDLDFSFGLKTSNELLQKLLSQGNLEDGLNVGATSLENILSSPDKIPDNQEAIARNQNLVNKIAVGFSQQGNTESATKAAIQSEIYSILLNHPILGEQLNKTLNFNALKHNSKENIFKDSCSLEETVKTVKLFGKKENLESLRNDYIKDFGKEEGEKKFKEVKESIQKKFEIDLFKLTNEHLKIVKETSLNDLNSSLSCLIDGVENIYQNLSPEEKIKKIIEITKNSLTELEADGFFGVMYQQFESLALFYTNAQREMEENPDKYPSFIDFLNSEEGNKGAGKELINNEFIQKIINLREFDKLSGTKFEEELLIALGIPKYLANKAIEANQLLKSEADQKGIDLSEILISNSNKKIEFSEFHLDDGSSGRSHDYSSKLADEEDELRKKNPDWKEKLEQEYNSRKNEQDHNSESLENVQNENDFLIEDNQQIKKEEVEISLFETTERFDTNRSIVPDEAERYKYSI